MIQSAHPYINFNGDASAALEFYCDVLGATAESVMRWGDGPMDVSPEHANNIMFAHLKIGEGALDLSDVPPHMTLDKGTNMSIMLNFKSSEEVDAVCERLAAGGTVSMPPEDMFWGGRFAKLSDKFGVQWMLHCALPQGDCPDD